MSPADPSQTILSAILILKIQLWFLYVVTSKTTLLGERKNFMQLKYAKTLRKKILTLNEMYSNVIIGREYLITCVYEKLKKNWLFWWYI